MSEPKEPYEVDDRGNVVQFYETKGYEIVATIDREAIYIGTPDADYQSTWDGGAAVTAWAMENGYPEVATLPQP